MGIAGSIGTNDGVFAAPQQRAGTARRGFRFSRQTIGLSRVECAYGALTVGREAGRCGSLTSSGRIAPTPSEPSHKTKAGR